MGLKEPGGLVLPRVRKPKRLPRVLSQEQMKRLIGLCDLYDKALLSTIYDCMFKAAWATVDTFAAKRGLTSGMTAILHSWGSNLFYHPHIHCIVPGGGVDKRGVWHHIKGCKHSDFLFPVAAMSTKFRGRFLAELSGKAERMSLLTRRLKEKDIVIEQSVRKHCFAKAWVVNSKPPAKGVGQVLEYIGRYAYRVAITNSRILDVTDSHISFDYKNYRSGGKHEVTNIRIDDFLTRLSQHTFRFYNP